MTFRWDSPFRLLAAGIRYLYARAAGYETLVTPQEADDREWECLDCEFYDRGQCRVCTCFVSAKVLLALEQCPKNKWKRIWRKKRGV